MDSDDIRMSDHSVPAILILTKEYIPFTLVPTPGYINWFNTCVMIRIMLTSFPALATIIKLRAVNISRHPQLHYVLTLFSPVLFPYASFHWPHTSLSLSKLTPI